MLFFFVNFDFFESAFFNEYIQMKSIHVAETHPLTHFKIDSFLFQKQMKKEIYK